MTAVARTRSHRSAPAPGRDRSSESRLLVLLVQHVVEHVELPPHLFRGEALAHRERLHALAWQLGVHHVQPDAELIVWLEGQGLNPRPLDDPAEVADVEAVRAGLEPGEPNAP